MLRRASSDVLYDVFPCIAPAVLCSSKHPITEHVKLNMYSLYTVSQKNDTDVAHYNFNEHQPILLISGRDVAERVCYQITMLSLRLKNVAPLPCKNCTNSSSFSFFHVYRVIRYTDELRNGSVLLRHGLNFSRAWWMIQLISGEKDWKHVSMQKVVTLNICCNIACLTFHLPHITTSSFQSHQCQPTTGFFQIHQRLENAHTFS